MKTCFLNVFTHAEPFSKLRNIFYGFHTRTIFLKPIYRIKVTTFIEVVTSTNLVIEVITSTEIYFIEVTPSIKLVTFDTIYAYEFRYPADSLYYL